MPHSELVQSLLKSLDLLKLISLKNSGVRLNELAAETGIKKTTLHNLLRTLCARGFLVKDNANRFKIVTRCERTSARLCALGRAKRREHLSYFIKFKNRLCFRSKKHCIFLIRA